MRDISLIAARRLQSKLQRLGHIAGLHRRTPLPGNHIAGEIIQNGGQIHPTPTDDLQVREVRLPHLIYSRGLVFELTGGLHDNEGRAGNQVMRL